MSSWWEEFKTKLYITFVKNSEMGAGDVAGGRVLWEALG
jgi:hypothetical protein